MDIDIIPSERHTMLIIEQGHRHRWKEWNRIKRQERIEAYDKACQRKPWLRKFKKDDDLRTFPPECHHFLTRALWDKLSIKSTLSHYMRGDTATCQHCKRRPETLPHIFKCTSTQDITTRNLQQLQEYFGQQEWSGALDVAHYIPQQLRTKSIYLIDYHRTKELLHPLQVTDPDVILHVRNRVALTASSIYRQRQKALRASEEDSLGSTFSDNSSNLAPPRG